MLLSQPGLVQSRTEIRLQCSGVWRFRPQRDPLDWDVGGRAEGPVSEGPTGMDGRNLTLLFSHHSLNDTKDSSFRLYQFKRYYLSDLHSRYPLMNMLLCGSKGTECFPT